MALFPLQHPVPNISTVSRSVDVQGNPATHQCLSLLWLNGEGCVRKAIWNKIIAKSNISHLIRLMKQGS